MPTRTKAPAAEAAPAMFEAEAEVKPAAKPARKPAARKPAARKAAAKPAETAEKAPAAAKAPAKPRAPRKQPADHKALTPVTARTKAAIAREQPTAARRATRKLSVVPDPEPVKTTPMTEVTALQEAVLAMEPGVIECRGLTHHWVHQTVRTDQSVTITEVLRCTNCTSTREQYIHKFTGRLMEKSNIHYVDGFLLKPGVSDGQRGAAKDFARITRLNRLIEKATANVQVGS